MCGLVGMIGTLERKHTDLMPDLLMVCQLRGRDSTGVIRVDHNDNSDWLKQVGTPDFLTNDPVYRQRIGNGLSKALIGHCRHKTVGDANRDNAHPFQHGHITGVHNGTLRQWKTNKDAQGFDVDSDWLFYDLSQNGEEETFSKLSHDSAYCCIWHNEENDTINFLRNNKRPLWFTWSDDKKIMFWASEIWMLGVISREKNIKLWEGDKDGNKFFALPVDTLWSFNVDRVFTKDKPSLTLRKAKVIKQMEEPKQNFTHTRGRGGTYTNNGWQQNNHGGYSRAMGKGGEVADPFLPDDQIDDVGKGKAAESTTTPNSSKDSKKSQSNVLDFRMGSRPSKSSNNSSPSLRERNTLRVQQASKEAVSNSCAKNSLTQKKGKVSLRHISAVGTSYITNNKTGRETTLETFEKETNGICCFCKTAIGDEKEVSEFITPTTFICTNCTTKPSKSITA